MRTALAAGLERHVFLAVLVVYLAAVAVIVTSLS